MYRLRHIEGLELVRCALKRWLSAARSVDLQAQHTMNDINAVREIAAG